MKAEVKGNDLVVTMGEFEARLVERFLPIMEPMISQVIYAMTRVLLLIAASGKESFDRCREKIERGEGIEQIMEEMGIDPQRLVDKSIEMPTQEELDRLYGFLDEQ